MWTPFNQKKQQCFFVDMSLLCTQHVHLNCFKGNLSNSKFIYVSSFQVGQCAKKNVPWITCAYQGKGVRFHDAQFNLFSWVWACIWIICQHAASNSGGWAGVPITKILCLPLPRFSFPYPMQTRGYKAKAWNMSETSMCTLSMDKDVEHNHMYDVQWWKLSDFPSTAKAEKQMREITRFISMFHVSCAFPRGRERVSSLWVFDVFRVCIWCVLICLIYVYVVHEYIPYMLCA